MFFSLALFFLTAIESKEIVHLVLGLVGKHSAVSVSGQKISYFSFGMFFKCLLEVIKLVSDSYRIFIVYITVAK